MNWDISENGTDRQSVSMEAVLVVPTSRAAAALGRRALFGRRAVFRRRDLFHVHRLDVAGRALLLHDHVAREILHLGGRASSVWAMRLIAAGVRPPVRVRRARSRTWCRFSWHTGMQWGRDLRGWVCRHVTACRTPHRHISAKGD